LLPRQEHFAKGSSVRGAPREFGPSSDFQENARQLVRHIEHDVMASGSLIGDPVLIRNQHIIKLLERPFRESFIPDKHTLVPESGNAPGLFEWLIKGMYGVGHTPAVDPGRIPLVMPRY
jgi:hypothetical protein